MRAAVGDLHAGAAALRRAPLQPTATSIDPDVRRARPRASEESLARHAVRDRSVRAARRPHHGVRRSAGGSGPAGAIRNPMAAMAADRSSHLEQLLDAWGVDFNPGEVVADRGHALHGGDAPGRAARASTWASSGSTRPSLHQSDVITAGPLQRQRRDRRPSEQRPRARTIKFEPLIAIERRRGADAGAAVRDAVRSGAPCAMASSPRASATPSPRASPAM